jgi:hypothetical protein
MDKVRKSSISVCYTPLSEPYSILGLCLKEDVTVLHFRYIGIMYITNSKKNAISDDLSRVLVYYRCFAVLNKLVTRDYTCCYMWKHIDLVIRLQKIPMHFLLAADHSGRAA